MRTTYDPPFVDLPGLATCRMPGDEAPTVLVVESDPDTNARCVQSLRGMGMRPEVAVTCDDAIARLSKAEPQFPVVCVDVVYSAVADAVRRLRPGAQILFLSDRIGDVLAHDGVVLCRPFTSDEFRRAHDAALLDLPVATDPSWINGADAVWPEEAAARRTA